MKKFLIRIGLIKVNVLSFDKFKIDAYPDGRVYGYYAINYEKNYVLFVKCVTLFGDELKYEIGTTCISNSEGKECKDIEPEEFNKFYKLALKYYDKTVIGVNVKKVI